MAEGIGGARTLGTEILAQGRFDHVVVDGGTGFQAGCLLAEFCHRLQLTRSERPFLHVVSIFEPGASLRAKVEGWARVCDPGENKVYEKFFCHDAPAQRGDRLSWLQEFGSQTGVLLDPQYTQPLMRWTLDRWFAGGLRGKTLVVHSGGGTGLFGFGQQFKGEALG